MAFAEGAGGLFQAGTPLQVAGFLALLCAIWIVFFIIFLVVGIWVYRDAESRGMEGTLWALGVVIGGMLSLIIGLIILIIYLVVRKDHPVGGYYAPYGYGTYPPPGAYPPPAAYPPPGSYGPPPAAPPSGPAAPPTAGPSASLTCTRCGLAIPAGGSFCPNCGTKV